MCPRVNLDSTYDMPSMLFDGTGDDNRTRPILTLYVDALFEPVSVHVSWVRARLSR